MSTEEMQAGHGPSPEQTAEDLANALAKQQARVQALSGPEVEDNPGMGMVLGEIDIAHEELRVAEEALRAQQRRLDDLLAERSDPRAWRRGLIGSLPVAALVTDLTGVVLEVNAAAWAMLGRPRHEILERPLAELVAASHQRQLAGALATVTTETAMSRVRLAVRTRDDDAWPVELVAGSDHPDAPGALITWVAADAAVDDDDHPSAALRTAEAFAEMCRLPLQSGADTRDVLARAAMLVEKAIPHSDGVSITLGPPAEPEAQATDNAMAQAVDGAQLQAGEGPCLSAYTTGTLMVCQDLREDERWQRLAPLAVPLGVAAVLGCPIRTERHCLGVLNIYSCEPDAFDARDRYVADLLVSAVLAVVQETRDRRELTELSDQLRSALDSRAVIDQAKGILMSRGRYGADTAFAQLVAESRRSNVKVRDIAQLVVDDATRAGVTPGEADGGRDSA